MLDHLSSLPASPAPATGVTEPARRGTGAGTDGNELLTSLTGATLIVLLAVIGLTIVAMHPLLSVHLFVGLALTGPLLLKLASTGYRFARYYKHDPAYRRKGPPAMPLRLSAPIVVVSTLTVMGSGFALLFAGPSSRDSLMPVHKISFIVWVVFTSGHVLGHLPELARAVGVRSELLGIDQGPASGPRPPVPAQRQRGLALASSLLAGLVLALALIPTYSSWLHASFHHH